jgi:CRP/FNR family transcriptional regulator
MSQMQRQLDDVLGEFLDSNDPLLEQLTQNAQIVKLEQNQFVFHAGDLCGAFLVVLQGTVRVQLTAASGREVTLYRISPGGSCILTTSCLLSQENYPAEAIAESEVVAVAIPNVVFQSVLERSARFRQLVFNGFSERLRNVIVKIEELAFTAIDSRLARLLLELDEKGIDEITHQVLSVELGTAREVISRHLKRFEQQGWLQLGRRQVIVIDRIGLEGIISTRHCD